MPVLDLEDVTKKRVAGHGLKEVHLSRLVFLLVL